MFQKIINLTKGVLTMDTYSIGPGEYIIVNLYEMPEEFMTDYRHLKSLNLIRTFDVEEPTPEPEISNIIEPEIEEPEVIEEEKLKTKRSKKKKGSEN